MQSLPSTYNNIAQLIALVKAYISSHEKQIHVLEPLNILLKNVEEAASNGNTVPQWISTDLSDKWEDSQRRKFNDFEDLGDGFAWMNGMLKNYSGTLSFALKQAIDWMKAASENVSEEEALLINAARVMAATCKFIDNFHRLAKGWMVYEDADAMVEKAGVRLKDLSERAKMEKEDLTSKQQGLRMQECVIKGLEPILKQLLPLDEDTLTTENAQKASNE